MRDGHIWRHCGYVDRVCDRVDITRGRSHEQQYSDGETRADEYPDAAQARARPERKVDRRDATTAFDGA